MDLYSTCVAASGASGNDVTDGQNLLPLLKQQSDFPARTLFWHYPHYSNQGGRPSAAIRDGDWKLIEFFEDGRHELYHLKNDPQETIDLAAQESKTASNLATRLAHWREQVAAKLPTPNPDFTGPGN
jgi:arylsulfatase A-like enzyme